MRKTIITIMAVCMALMTQCRKNDVQPQGGFEPSGETIDVALDASTGDDKTTIDGYTVSWVSGDKIHVVGTLDGYLGYMTAQSSGTAVKFKGTIKKTTAAQNYYFYYVGDNSFALSGDDVLTFSVANQYGILSGNANSIANKFMLLKGSLYVSGTPGGELGHVTMNSMLSIARLSLVQDGASMTSGTVTVSGGYSSVKINTKTGEYVSSNPLTSGNITLNNASGDYYMALIPGNQTSSGTSQTMTFTASGCQTLFTVTIAANEFYNKDVAKEVNMVASVETDEWINFNDPTMEVAGLPIWSKKNLGAICSTDNPTDSMTALTWWGDYYAWGATFTWYEAGYAQEVPQTHWKTVPKNYQSGYIVANAPYYTGSLSGTYTKYNESDGYTELEVADDAAHVVLGEPWRIPTGGASGEWQQLKDNTYFLWTANYRGITGLKGYIVYKVKVVGHKGYLTFYNSSTNTWNTMDASGTVQSLYEGQQNPFNYTISDPHLFLPASRDRDGKSLRYIFISGTYWSSSLYSSSFNSAHKISFGGDGVNMQSYDSRGRGFTVRPVR